MKLNFLKIISAIVISTIPFLAYSETDASNDNKDSVKNYYMQPVEVSAKRNPMSGKQMNIGTDYQSDILNKHGFQTLRRGGTCTQDIYMEGYKRNDIKVMVDGETCHSACPNRMDNFATRINPMEISTVQINKNSALFQSGLGGNINYIRINPQDKFKARLGINTSLVSSEDVESMLGIEGMNQMVNVRFATGKGYKSGDSKTMEQLYSFSDNYRYNYGSVSYKAVLSDDIIVGAGFNIANNIRFPYLQMDEKNSYTYNVNGAYMGHRLYINYTSHLMDNTLRLPSPTPMLMSTDAKNLTMGLNGNILDYDYNVIYRNWDANNLFYNPKVKINNRLMPKVGRLEAEVSRIFEIKNTGFAIAGKVGYAMTNVGETNYDSTYFGITKDPALTHNNILAGLSIGYDYDISEDIRLMLMGESSLDNPSPEEYYITVKKPGTNPDWIGNPSLKQPLKFGGRATISYDFIKLEGFASYISNYVNLAKVAATPKPYLSYYNINAIIAGFNAGVDFKYFTSDVSFIYGENKTNSMPLSEIAPLIVTNQIKVPEFLGINTYIRHIYSSNQMRVDNTLGETTSAAWNRLDLGLSYQFSKLDLNLEVINLLNNNYYNYLSYSRNPFSSGMKVYEPGTVLKLSMIYRYE